MMGAGEGRGGSGAVGSLPNPSEVPGQPHSIDPRHPVKDFSDAEMSGRSQAVSECVLGSQP